MRDENGVRLHIDGPRLHIVTSQDGETVGLFGGDNLLWLGDTTEWSRALGMRARHGKLLSVPDAGPIFNFGARLAKYEA